MNTPHITFPTPPPELRLKRTSERRTAQLGEMQAALQRRERELEAYAARLQAMHDDLNRGQPAPSVAADETDDTKLNMAWAKLHRARQLLEDEQRQLCSDRVALHEASETLRCREMQLAAREAAVAETEARLQAAPQAKPRSTLFGLTRAPFGFGKTAGG